ncbi:hypothetical protein [Halalkalibacter alkalisediminis]|uniref:Uncharacterized protein n=1 Tax=Halalkalibacter alkalisediminis TaxID=935616 RepID=A0ABV6NEP2_9BACI|nr:hypothetical protein [Halalkalibacter alkalisediminis]
MVLLAQKEVESVMSQLNEQQVSFLTQRMKVKKKSRWLQVLANYKGINIDEKMSNEEIEERLEDWVLVDLLDGGYKKRPHKCDCGQSIRFQYIIENITEGTVRHLGENCFENYLSLPSNVIKDVKNGMYAIDLERDDILVKYKKNLFYPLVSYMHVSIPQDIIDQYELGLPLSDHQIALVERLHARYEEEKKLSSLFQRLTIEQQQFVSKLNQEDRRELLLSTEDGLAHCFFLEDDLSEYEETTRRQIELHLPLLERQKQEISAWKLAKQRQEQLHSLTSEQREFVLSCSNKDQDALLDRVRKPLYYSIESIQKLPLDARIKKQIELKLPLLDEQVYQINVVQNRQQNILGSLAR